MVSALVQIFNLLMKPKMLWCKCDSFLVLNISHNNMVHYFFPVVYDSLSFDEALKATDFP